MRCATRDWVGWGVQHKRDGARGLLRARIPWPQAGGTVRRCRPARLVPLVGNAEEMYT